MDSSYTDWAWPWWTVMVMINAVNLAVCAMVYMQSLHPKDGSDSSYRRRMRIMGVVFTMVGAYRSIFVSRYITQLAWFDTMANSALLIRMFAIAAELSFSGLIAFGMLRVNSDLPVTENNNANNFKSFMTTKSPYILLIAIVIAQLFATSGLITKNKTLFAVEETLWTVGFLAVLPLAIIQLRRVYGFRNKESTDRTRVLRKFTILNAVWCSLYVCYGLFYHLPIENWPGAINQLETGLPLIRTGTSAIVDAFVIVNESKEYSDWGFGFLLWHSAYFTICVWFSIFLMQAPRIIRSEKSYG